MIWTDLGAAGLAWLLVVIPFGVAAVLLLLGKLADRWGHWLGVAGLVVPFGLAVAMLVQAVRPCPPTAECTASTALPWFTWIQAGSLKIDASLTLDHLSLAFVLLVTGVGSLIFIYAVAYMAHDPGRRRFFGYLNIFAGSMLLLVLASNYAVLFVGWEGVGLASYLLIGFWQHKPSAALAAKKAFLMNRIGDLGLLGAMALLFANLGSVGFPILTDMMGDVSGGPLMTAVGLLLLLAACGKSAQFPLQSWLLDAMEGPTPVSALIHAATMVTAGVYLVVRSQAVFIGSEIATWAVAIVGVVTLLIGAWIGTAKRDIKKVLAGSTMSQIGYMMLAAGLGPVGAAFAIFHLLTHGAFKANLFLGAGAVMHGMADDTDIVHFGALRKAMPWTFLTFACGTLALIGFPLTSGYYSKDHIITAAFDKSPTLGGLALLGAVVTAYYMTRLVLLTFFGEKRWQDGVHAHDAPALMIVPMAILAVLSLAAGALLNGQIVGWLGGQAESAPLFEFTWITAAAFGALVLGVLIGWLVYRRGPVDESNFVLAAANAELGFNAVNDVVVKGSDGLAQGVTLVDRYLVDGGGRGLTRGVAGLSGLLRSLQNGMVRSYGAMMAFGLVVILAVIVVWQVM